MTIDAVLDPHGEVVAGSGDAVIGNPVRRGLAGPADRRLWGAPQGR